MLNYLAIVLVFLTTLYFYTTRTFKYWKNRGVKYEEPLPLFGSNLPNVLGKQNRTILAEKLYWKYPEERVVGYFYFTEPTLIIRDPDLLATIFATQFRSFYVRGYLEGQHKYKIETLLRNVFFAEGDLWRLMSRALTPSFTGSKIKAMFPIVLSRTERLCERLTGEGAGAQPVDAVNLMARYNIDFISAYALGIDSDSQKEEHSETARFAFKICRKGRKDIFVYLLKLFFPETFKNLKYLANLEEDFCNFINSRIKDKASKQTSQNDFIDFMLNIKAKGPIESEVQSPDGTVKQISLELNNDLIAAQVFMFFTAGFDTNTASTSYTLHELAYNPEIQKKVQDNIASVLAKHNNVFSYEAIKEMHYLEWTFKEGMRVFPPGGNLTRICQKDCELFEGLTVMEGTRVVIPVSALHKDPKYWDSPEVFRPERFSPEINEPKHKSVYLAFGAGPRACTGERLGMMQSLTALAAILSRFTVSPAPTSLYRPPLNPKINLVQSVLGGLPLIFTPRLNDSSSSTSNSHTTKLE